MSKDMERALVERRAKGRCEYCRAPQDICGYTFHLEHIVPRSRGGPDEPANEALSCWSCNSAKRDFVTGCDPSSGREEPLFHPRLHRWDEHFMVSANFCEIEGQTPIGRATVVRLRMNDKRFQPKARRLWLQAGRWP